MTPLSFRSPFRRRSALLLAALLLPGAAAHAQGYAPRDIGPWVVSPSSDKQGCFLTRTFPAPRETTLQLGLDTDGSNRLTILNARWSVREKERLRLTYRLSRAAFPRHLAIGLAAEGKKGFVTTFGAAFPATFAASRFLHITRGDVPVEELDLEGSGTAIAELRKCVASYRGAPPAGRTIAKDTGRIPADPFAVKVRRDSRK
ncbi:hypothetical protein [Sphingomonas adhaesiva]|uniref:hypothetical protein n=1 Tax=Sphingomonas adhaesiva TaxID=28212 RepID=UPI002FF984E6